MSDSRTYSRSLIFKGHGYPLFNPQPFDDLPLDTRRTGTEIGDVGIITSDGSFDVIFNIFRAADDPLNRFGVPDGFEQVKLSSGDIAPQQLYFRPGADVSSTKITKRRLDIDAGVEGNVFFPLGAGAVVEISTSSQTAAVLLLPDGASRTNLRPRRIFRDYALKHGQRWYAFVNGDLDRMVENGDLYLVTGVDKCSSWSLAAIENEAEGCGLSLKLKAASVGSASASCAWEWECASSFANSGPRRRPEEELWTDNQCVFLRGFKVAIRSTPLKRLGKTKVKSTEDLKPSEIQPRGRSMPISRRLSDGFGWLFVSSSGELSDGTKPYHPSDVINAYLLDSSPDAVVAVTHDDEWASVVTESKGLPSDAELLERVLDRYTVENRSDGGVCLEHIGAAGVVPETATPAESTKDAGFNATSDVRNDEFEDLAPGAIPDAENIENLGETVLRLVVTSIILDMYPRLQVGPSTQLRKLLLDNAALDKISNECKLPKLQELQPLHAGTNTFLVSVGVIYRNEGLESVNRLLEPVFRPYTTRAYDLLREVQRMSSLRESNGPSSSSSMPASPSTSGTTGGTSAPQSPTSSLTRFNEAVQKAGRRADWVYGGDASGSTSAQGKAKAAWTVEVLVDGEVFGRGEGSTKKAARNEAAKQALLRLWCVFFSVFSCFI